LPGDGGEGSVTREGVLLQAHSLSLRWRAGGSDEAAPTSPLKDPIGTSAAHSLPPFDDHAPQRAWRRAYTARSGKMWHLLSAEILT